MNVKLENKKTQVPHKTTQHQLNQVLDIRNSESTPFASPLKPKEAPLRPPEARQALWC